jgi:molecular chaperone GrpE
MSKKTQIEIQDENHQNARDDATDSDPTTAPETTETADASDDLAAKLEAAEKEGREHYDRLLRVSAEFDNYKKRTSREMQDLAKFATEKLLKELLSVVDNLERAVESGDRTTEQADPLLEGVQLTLDEMLKMLDRYKVTPVKSLGEPFDPAFHQAMMQEEVDDQPPNTVVREMQKGYMLHDRLLRPALVAVSKSKTNQDKDN